MAKTLVTQENILASIDRESLKHAFVVICNVAKEAQEEGALSGIASDVHELQTLADKFTDLGKAISEAIKNAEGVYYSKHGEVTDGFKLKNTGYTTSVKDFEGFVAEAEAQGANMGELKHYATITAKNAAKWLGLSDDRFEAEYADFIDKKKKADSLVRSW